MSVEWFKNTDELMLGEYYWVRGDKTDIFPEIVQLLVKGNYVKAWELGGKELVIVRMGLATRFDLSYYKDCEFLKINAPLA